MAGPGTDVVMVTKHLPANATSPRYDGTDLGGYWGIGAQPLCSFPVSTHPKQVTWKVGSAATLDQQRRAPGWGREA